MLEKRRENQPEQCMQNQTNEEMLFLPIHPMFIKAVQAKSSLALKTSTSGFYTFVSIYFAISTPPVAPNAFLISP